MLEAGLQRVNLNWAGGTATVDAMKQLTVAALGLWLGAMGFFAFVVAPAAFSTLDREAAGRFVSAVFPKYYAVGFGLGLVALAALAVRILGRGVRPLDWVPIGLLVLMLTLTLFAGAVVLPAAHAAREAMRATGADPAAAVSFSRLHRLSSVLNVVVMLAGLGTLIMEAVRAR
jgi:Domain of unknown function (DUF4149)